MNGESSVDRDEGAMKLHHDPHPWDDLWRSAAVEHPLRDAWWDERDLRPLLANIDIPVYLGCDWQNVPLHLPGTLATFGELSNSPDVRLALLGEYGLTWPWESLHVEALAWFDHWLKGDDTGILDGPPIRYRLPGSDEWRTATSWPPAGANLQELALRADATLGATEATSGTREYMTLGAGLNRAQPSPTDPPSMLTWTSEPLPEASTWSAKSSCASTPAPPPPTRPGSPPLQDVDPDGTVTDVTAGCLRASLREVDEDASRPGSPVLPCRDAAGVPIGEFVNYRIPLVGNARRFAAGHRIRLVLTSDDQDPQVPAIMAFRHASVGTSSLNTIMSTSRLLLPVLDLGHA